VAAGGSRWWWGGGGGCRLARTTSERSPWSAGDSQKKSHMILLIIQFCCRQKFKEAKELPRRSGRDKQNWSTSKDRSITITCMEMERIK
jgi:hypothetical protein